jgi:hypothetical protein
VALALDALMAGTIMVVIEGAGMAKSTSGVNVRVALRTQAACLLSPTLTGAGHSRPPVRRGPCAPEGQQPRSGCAEQVTATQPVGWRRCCRADNADVSHAADISGSTGCQKRRVFDDRSVAGAVTLRPPTAHQQPGRFSQPENVPGKRCGAATRPN